jgi:hypothetical protein
MWELTFPNIYAVYKKTHLSKVITAFRNVAPPNLI